MNLNSSLQIPFDIVNASTVRSYYRSINVLKRYTFLCFDLESGRLFISEKYVNDSDKITLLNPEETKDYIELNELTKREFYQLFKSNFITH